MNRVCITLLLCCLSSCRMNKTERMEMSEDSIDTVRIDQGVGKKTVSDSLKIGIADDGDYLQRQLLAIHEELRKRLNNTPYTHIQRNVTEYPVFSTKALHATFILSNHSGGDLTCGEHYYLTFEDEKGTWRELPINAAFWDIAYVLRDGEERVMKASLYPDVHPNKPGRYRYFYEITIRRKPVLMMAEFRLTDNEEEWRTAEKTSLPPYISDAGKGGSPQLITEEPMEEPVYKVVEVMPEFPGGMKALMDFIQKNIRYPEEVRKNGIQGRVAVSVVIDENVRVTDPVIMLLLNWSSSTR